MLRPSPAPRSHDSAAWHRLCAQLPSDWGTWVAVVVLVAVGLWQLPQATSAGHRPAPSPTEFRPAPECPTLTPDEPPNRHATRDATETETENVNVTVTPADNDDDRTAGATEALDDELLQDWRYARGKWIRLSEELGIPPPPANFAQRVSPLLWAALLWLAATWILVAST